jgi:hypothetical protein
MISGSAALTASNTTTGSLSYISELVSGATEQGLYRIVVGGQHMNDTMADNLTNTYGYEVNVRNSFMGTLNEYIISWGSINPAVPTVPAEGSGTITFNGTDQFVTAFNADVVNWLPGTGDFTIEWFMKKGVGGTSFPRVFSLGFNTSATIGCSIEGGRCYIWPYGNDLNGLMPAGYNSGADWTHIAICRDSTDTTRLYIDGDLVDTKLNDNRNITDSVNAGFDLNMGVDDPEAGSPNWWSGKLTNFRWDNSAIYTGSTLNVPSEPLTETATTKLLLLGGSVANPVFDASGNNDLENNGAEWNVDTPFV